MSDYEVGPIDPEFEYAASSWQKQQEGQYRTGSTTPPKDYGWVTASVLVVMILFGSLSSLLSMMNITLFASDPTAAYSGSDNLTFTQGTGAVSSLEPSHSTETVRPQVGDAMIQISDTPQSTVPTTPLGETEPTQDTAVLSWQQVYSKVIDSVVSITCTGDGTASSGTGVIMSKNGYIITNEHVVSGASAISVLLTDGRTMTARIVGQDSLSDLAVLYVEATDLTPAEFGSSASLRVGDEVVAIGDPLGVELRGTMTDGIISAISRDLEVGGRTMTLIQTTAALNAGNSGGPLVNCYGQVVGINTMKIGDYTNHTNVQGLGFAIPMSTVKEVVEQLIRSGYVEGRPDLGLEGRTVSSFYRYYYHLPEGLMITSLEPDSDACAKGLRNGDIILSANGSAVTDADSLREIVNGCQVGDTIELVIYRAGREYTVAVTVMEANNG